MMNKFCSNNSDNKTTLSQIPAELKYYFFLRLSGCIIAAILTVCFILSSRLYNAGVFFFLTIMIYLAYHGYLLYKALTGKILVFEGVCEDVYLSSNEPKKYLMKKFIPTLYGKSEIHILIQDKKFVIPVSHNFSGSSGQTIRVYTLETGIFPITDNAFTINNPILVKVIKL